MAKKPTAPADDADFHDEAASGRKPESPPVVQPPVPAPKIATAAELIARLTTMTGDSPGEVVMVTDEAAKVIEAAKAAEVLQLARSRAEHEYIRAQAQKSARERTQEVCDAAYGADGSPRFNVSLSLPQAAGGFFPLSIPAADREQAMARYTRLMGIRSHGEAELHVAPAGTPVPDWTTGGDAKRRQREAARHQKAAAAELSDPSAAYAG